MNISLTSKLVIELFVFVFITIDFIGHIFYSKVDSGTQSKSVFINKALIFYIISVVTLLLFDGDILQMGILIHLAVILGFFLLTCMGVLIIKTGIRSTFGLNDMSSRNNRSKKILMIFAAIIVILSILGLTTERLKDFSFTGSNVIIISTLSEYEVNDFSDQIKDAIEYDVIKIQKIGMVPLHKTQNIKIEFNSLNPVKDSLIESRLYENLEPFTNGILKDDFVVSRAKYGLTYDSRAIDGFYLIFLFVTVVLLIFFSIYFKSLFSGLKVLFMIDFLLFILIGFLLFLQKIIPDFVVDGHLFHVIIFSFLFFIFKSYMNLPASNRCFFKGSNKNEILNLLGLIIFTIPITYFFGFLVIPLVSMYFISLMIPFLGRKIIYRNI